jgi:hypothetical protein|tara:strand:+ start:616 stop:744 length:129 start_codon:yes stop_codon:yes gene_type:complete
MDREDREKKNAAYHELIKKREKKELKYNSDGNEWTADMPEKT